MTRIEIHKPPEPTAPYGWLVKDTRCPMCGHRCVHVIPVGATGIECSVCGYAEPEYVWEVGQEMPGRG